jgi:predicted lipid-binding transport protein (Tim44 family)
MKKFLWLVMIFAVLASVLAEDANAARRLGGGRSIGQQRQSIAPRPAPPQAAPQPAPSNPAAPARPGMGRWLAPLAGLALGLGLAHLFGAQAGSLVAGLLLAAVVGAIALFLFRMLGRNRPLATAAHGMAGPQPAVHEASMPPPALQSPGPGVERPEPVLPAGFEAGHFLEAAKKNFLALYSAHDRGDVAFLREMTTDQMFSELQQEITARTGPAEPVQVVTLDAQLVDVSTEGATHWARIRFSGMVREDSQGAPTHFDEIWNLRKPVSGAGGWVLAGIQQVN